MDAPRGCVIWHSGMEATVDAPQLPGLRIHATASLWERDANRGHNCRALAQAARLKFGLPYPFTAPEALADYHLGPYL